MIILDTNVISEPLKPRPDARVAAWLDSEPVEQFFLTATNLAELWVGATILPEGRRKDDLEVAIDEIVTRLFESRFLSFDRAAAMAYPLIVRRAMTMGFTIAVADAQIAAIAAVHGFKVATRDTAPFIAAGIPVINPWEA